MKLFAKIFSGCQPLSIFAKSSILDVWLHSKCASAFAIYLLEKSFYKNFNFLYSACYCHKCIKKIAIKKKYFEKENVYLPNFTIFVFFFFYSKPGNYIKPSFSNIKLTYFVFWTLILFLALFLLNLYQTWRYYTEMHQNTQVRIQEVDQGDWSPSPKM